MGKSIYIAEKPSVAKEFAKALKYNMKNKDGYLESDEAVVTWCVGHLVTMSYPEVYDEKYKRWSLDTIPFIPEEFKYEVIGAVRKQFQIVSGLLNREDIETIYVCTDSGREGEYIYRLVEQQAHVLANLGVKRAMVVHGLDCMDEISLSAPTFVCEMRNGEFKTYEITPEQFGLNRCKKEDLVGGNPEENAKITLDILSGKTGAKFDAVVLNAGAAIYIADGKITIEEGIEKAKETLFSGRAKEKLEKFVAKTNTHIFAGRME